MYSVNLKFPVPANYQDEIIKNLYWIDPGITKIWFDQDNPKYLHYHYQNAENLVSEEALSAQLQETIAQHLKQTTERLTRSLNLLPGKVVYESPVEFIPGCSDPYQLLLENNWIHPDSAGTHAYSGLMSQLFYSLDNQFRHQAVEMEIPDWKFPSLMDIDTLIKCGYLEGFPHNANLVSHLPEQLEVIEEFKASIVNCQQLPDNSLDRYLTRPTHALSPAVCYHFYQSHQKSILPDSVVAATAISPCYRYESKAMKGLRRLREFNMREIIFLGSQEIVLSIREQLLERKQKLLEMTQLKAKIETASDPFFLDTFDKQHLYQISFDLKHEVKAYLPDEDSWLAIGSVNYHQDHFGKAFNIRVKSGEYAHSCCMAFGVDRWCLAIFAQYGLDINQWPQFLSDLVSNC